jgi:hypothetical protein
MYCTPGPDNSSLINTEKAVPNKPENKANIKYSVPMSLALLDKNHLSTGIDISESFFIIFSLYETFKLEISLVNELFSARTRSEI